MRLHFTSFNTESGYDKVCVYDGKDTTARRLYTFSGTSLPSDVFSGGNNVFVSFVTDGGVTKDGFNIVYSTIIPVSGEFRYHRYKCRGIADSEWRENMFEFRSALTGSHRK